MSSSLRRWPVVVCAVALACAPAQPAPKRSLVRFIIGTPGGGIYPLAAALAREYQASFPDLDIVVNERTAAVNNITTVALGNADLAFGYADVVYAAFVGDAQHSEHPPSDQIRGLMMLQLAPIHLVVGPHVAVRSIRDLTGLRVGVGQPLSSTQLEAEILLDAHHVDRSRMRLESLPFDRGRRAPLPGHPRRILYCGELSGGVGATGHVGRGDVCCHSTVPLSSRCGGSRCSCIPRSFRPEHIRDSA